MVRTTENGYELIAGEQRLRAHQHLGRATILARVLEATDLSSASLSLIENLQREQLNPVEEALGYSRSLWILISVNRKYPKNG